jgi:protein phosphatase
MTPHDVTAEFAREELAGSPWPAVRLRLSIAAKTDMGRVREHNEDKHEFFVPEDPATLAARGATFLVCDGMGGHAAGQVAAELAAKTFLDVYYSHSADQPEPALEAAVRAANRYVLDLARAIPGRRGMGCTLSAAILHQDRLLTVQVGDSRIYRLREGALTQLTRDHTFVEEMVRYGSLSREQAEAHPQRHVLTRAIGGDDPVVPEIDAHDLAAGDLLLVCSDGLLNEVPDPEILRVLTSRGPAEAAWHLVGMALQAGGRDNVTVLLVRVDSIENVEPSA